LSEVFAIEINTNSIMLNHHNVHRASTGALRFIASLEDPNAVEKIHHHFVTRKRSRYMRGSISGRLQCVRGARGAGVSGARSWTEHTLVFRCGRRGVAGEATTDTAHGGDRRIVNSYLVTR